MWNHCISYYGYLLQIHNFHLEPMEWKRDGDNNGGGEITELLKALHANTSSKMGLSHTYKLIEKQQLGERVGSIQTAMLTGEMEQEGIELTLRTHSSCVCKQLSSLKEDSVIC
jgi:hypothetical protein